MKTTVYRLDPLADTRWPGFLARHPCASIFHTRGWLGALQSTYGYEPIAFTTSDPGADLANAVVFCQVRSWLTGLRLVSLPFSDHCQPLAEGAALGAILDSLQSQQGARWKYIEIRPLSAEAIESENFSKSSRFSFHKIDLRPDLDVIYRSFQDSCVRRKIKRAEREQLTYEAGRSEELLQKFRELLVMTRRRHKLPPQPNQWYRNLVRGLGDALTIHVLSKEAQPIASIITLAFKKSLVYKYGCSDSKYHNLGGTSLLFWNAIRDGKQNGAEEFDLGRSAPEDPGLIAFKGHLGAAATELSYYRHPVPTARDQDSDGKFSWARQVVARLPEPVFSQVGRLLYRHLG
jgi:hypothetical protein